jgi:EAL and modified HD-GYP domain-containing signal transduction protein
LQTPNEQYLEKYHFNGGTILMEIYVARQPIFKKNKKVLGYELLFREGMSNVFPNIDGDTATSKLLSNTFFSIGIDKITGNNLAFINFTEDLLLKHVPQMFPKDHVVVELLEHVRPVDEVVEACKSLKSRGYRIALDDFLYSDGMESLIDLADIIKFDFREMPHRDIAWIVKKLSGRGVNLLAEKVESHEEFQMALKMGFRYFQGYFFSRPEIIQGKEIGASQMQLMEIMAEANKTDLCFDRLEKIITRDISISFKLLRLINSSYFRRVQEISSIKQAIVMIGETGIRRFVSLIAMAGLAENKPEELVKSSIMRAKFCELLSGTFDKGIDPSERFTVGLFSLIDAIMDDNMANLMVRLPLTENIKQALIFGKGVLGDLLTLVGAYERGEWRRVSELTGSLGIGEGELPIKYLEALEWADCFTMA